VIFHVAISPSVVVTSSSAMMHLRLQGIDAMSDFGE
jgi:hypothetical protein